MSDVIINTDIQVPTHITLKYDVEVPFVTLVTQADWEETDSTKKGFIQHKPELASVATSGNYNDLENLPTIPTVPTNVSSFTNDAGYITKNVNNLTNYTKSSDLAPVATSGDYHDLINLPIIPVQLQSDWNQTNTSAKDYIKNKPTVLSAFLNDTGFINNTVNNLVNYPLSSSLATVATSGSYNDLNNKPEIPSIEGLVSETFVGNAISTHNTSNNSHSDIKNSISTINGKIPEQASTSNQLADKNFVNSSVATNTAYFLATLDIIDDLHLTYDATMIQVVTALNSYSFGSVKTNNDYCNVITQDNVGNILFERFKWNSQEETFKYEFSLNNSSFTAVQWASINSNATAENIAQIAQNVLAISALQADLNSKVNKSGDMMTGDLNIGLNNIIFDQSTTSYKSKIQADASGLVLWTSGNGGTTYNSALKLFNVQDKVYFHRNNIYTGYTEDEAHRLQTGSDLATKLADYLPLTGGDLTGDVSIAMGKAIKFPKETGFGFRIESPTNNSIVIHRTAADGESNKTQQVIIASGQVVFRGDVYANGTSTANGDKLIPYSVLFKQGIVSQTQTWTQNADDSYSYAMSNPVTGDIPITFIELVEELGAVFNETTGYFELNSLVDISYKEMKAIYATSSSRLTNIIYSMWKGSKSRTNFFNVSEGTVDSQGMATNMGLAFTDCNQEVNSLAPQNQHWSSIDIGTARLYVNNYVYQGTNGIASMFRNNRRLKHILGTVRMKLKSSTASVTNAFQNATSLETVWLTRQDCDLDIHWSPNLRLECLVFLIENRFDGTEASTSLTVTVHPIVYATCQADTTEYTYSGQTYVGIISYATARNISIASA